MGMGRGGLVAYVEAQIERDIALGRLHPSGRFGSEAKLARRYETCRGTIREALRRLAARGLVVQRPGRKTRAVALDESLTLENLGLVLHDARSPEARWFLEGSFSLKRQVLVELLVDYCAKAPAVALNRLMDTCFRLQDAARWESGVWCAQVEFELLRLAARVAERPGYVLLVQSLQRAFLGGAAMLLPLMGGESLREWARCAMEALGERDALTLQNALPSMMKACDERVLAQFTPAVLESHRAQECLLDAPAPATAHVASPASQAEGLASGPCDEEHAPGHLATASVQETPPDVAGPGLGHLAPTTGQDAALEAHPLVAESGHGFLAPASEALEEPGVALRSHAKALPMKPDNGALFPVPTGLDSSEPQEDRVRDVKGAVLGALSDRRTGWGTSSPKEGLQAEPSSTGDLGQTSGAVRNGSGLHHGTLGRLGLWAARFWRFISHSLDTLLHEQQPFASAVSHEAPRAPS
ncbi:FadR/GntR family transcriptional regulator [Corallococcus sp. AS-1-6]|uniref:FadR/GntR family transcriptional regulator n=1 Tax=Corallococcus sp. AS-1-6 TaxID=2874599 RepID=UPI001CC16EE6|nr:GntR family transcriptional regulator [Corallococcus sp. AS-1-6]MBZ4377409.1 GntR family transcriptional regulator [Corallococcus sp. AS-1-6]